jgi:predicted ArsR family transcriptional regulator
VPNEFDLVVEAVGLLADPVRRAMYGFVRSQPGPVSREDVATGTGASVKLAAFHLEKLLERGLLRARYQRQSRPQGGRPAKLYEPSPQEVAVSLPPRRYDLMGEVLAEAAPAGGQAMRSRAREVASERGKEAGQRFRDEHGLRRAGRERTLAAAGEVLRQLGFEPQPTGPGELCLTNCPFLALSQRDPDVVCALNEAFVAGTLAGLGGRGVQASLERAPSRCCVVLRFS